jgi:hypothetical protein
MRFPLLVTVLAVLAMAAPAAAAASTPAAPASLATPHAVGTLVAFRSHFGLGRSRSRGYGFGGVSRRSSRHPLLRRVVKTAIWLYVLHLFFSHGGLSILLWIVIIGLVVSLLRRRRRRYAY